MLSHVSATSIKLYKSCPRRWYERYVLGKKGETSAAMQRGQEVHRQLEEYLTSGTKPDSSDEGLIAKSGLKHLPEPSKDHDVEISLESLPIEDTPAPFKGFIDLYMSEDKTEDGIPEVVDHKTTSNFKYALTAKDLSEDTQMLIYAAHVLHNTEAEFVRLTHVCYLTKPPYQSQHTTTIVSREYVYERFNELLEIVEEMVAASELPADALEKNKSYCWSYGKRCPFYDGCQRTINHAGVKHMSEKQLSVIDKLRGKAAPQAQSVAPVTTTSGGSTIYVDCTAIKGQLTPLQEGLSDLIKTVCTNKGAEHIDLIAYMAGYGLLSAAILENGLPEGDYYVTSSSNYWAKCSDALIAKADKVIIGR